MDTDVLVLGMGAVGAFTLLALAERGLRAVGIERFDRTHDRGSSHGGTRITRQAYFEHPDYVPLIQASTADFEALAQHSGQPLLERCGVLLLGGPGSLVLRESARAAEHHGIPVQTLDLAELRQRYPMFRFAGPERGLLEPGAGFVRPEAAILAALDRAEALGARVLTQQGVESWTDAPQGVRVRSNGVELRARALVIAGGAWAPVLVPSIASLLRVTRQVQAWIELDDPAPAMAGTMPCWLIDRGGEHRHLYGIPVDPLAPGPARAKIAVHGSDSVIEPDRLDRRVAPSETHGLAELARRHLPGLSGTVQKAAACMYTSTPDGHFLVDRVPGTRSTWMVAGLSGHGFKMAPALGRAVADLATLGRTDAPIGFLGLGRFSG